MRHLIDLVYFLFITAISPILLYRAATTGKYRRGILRKFLGLTPVIPSSSHPVIPSSRHTAWFHGVSVGEVHLLRQVVAVFRRRHPDWQCVLSTTTDTGFDEARKNFPDLTVFYWPLDFSWAVRRALRRIRPTLVVLAEGDLWPNFLLATKEMGIPVAVVNGRMSPRSFRRHRTLSQFTRRLLKCIDVLAVQTSEYAANYRTLGAEGVHVTGSVKYDGVAKDPKNPCTDALRTLFQVTPDDAVWIAGSTQAPEEEICLDIFRRLQPEHPNLRLFIVPRQKDRFDEVANLLQRTNLPFVRRSQLLDSSRHPVIPSSRHPVILVDTIGELGALWGLAHIAFVGGSLDGKRGGQNMIEPAAYGAAVLFGPQVWNFRDTAERLTSAGAAIQVADAAALEFAVRRLLKDEAERQRLGSAARDLVHQQQGATERTMDLLDQLIDARGLIQLAA